MFFFPIADLSKTSNRKRHAKTQKIGIDDKPEVKKIKIHDVKPKGKKQLLEVIVESPVIDNEAIPDQTKKFQCEHCGKSFNSKDNYNLHITIHMKIPHGKQICKMCTKCFISIDDLIVHMNEKHKDTPISQQSQFEQDYKDDANDQTKETKPVKKVAAKPFKCSYCGSKFSQKHNLKTHIKKKHENDEKKHSCPHCGLKFLLIQTLDNHIDTEHKENVIDIEIMKSEENLETNSKSVDEESYNLDTSSKVSMSKPFTCHHCKEAFSSERNMELHIDFHHELKNEEKNPYKCLECDFSCLKKEEFSTHISSVHEVKKPYECSKCNALMEN